MTARPTVRRRTQQRRGFTLLEVLLALTILVGSLATIGELARIGMRHAHRAAASAQAQLYCESKLAELTAGLLVPTAIPATPLAEDPAWTYSVAVEPTFDAALLAVRVTVAENLPPQQGPVEFSLVRWMTDPEATAAAEAAAAAAAATTEANP